MTKKKRILFFAEAVTLAHVARSIVLARSLDPDVYEVCFACDPRYNRLMGTPAFPMRAISTISGSQFLKVLSKGSPIYDVATLRGYVEEEMQLIDEFKPDVVIGDFRLSLSVSSQKKQVPYITVTNAYWSPFSDVKYVIPEVPITKWFGVRLSQALFDLTRPIQFAIHSRPLNQTRKYYGLPSMGSDLRRVYTQADYTFFADLPELVPTVGLSQTHRFIGPILWSPEIPRPAWWNNLPQDKPVIYVTMGSSGQSDALPTIIEALSDLPVSIIVATAGLIATGQVASNVFTADFLPGEQAAAVSSLVICNGGSPTCYQAFAAGVPVLGVASNLDQYLNMSLVQRAGAGLLIRAGQVSAGLIKRSVETVLKDPAFKQNAEKIRQGMSLCNVPQVFNSELDRVLS